MHLHASNWQHKFYFQHYTTPRDVPRQHSINSYLIPPLVLRLPSYLPPPSLLLQFYTVRRHIIMFSRTYCWCTEISTCAHDCCLCGKEKGKKQERKTLPRLHRCTFTVCTHLWLQICLPEKPQHFSESDLEARKQGFGKVQRGHTGYSLRWNIKHKRSAPLAYQRNWKEWK